VRPSINKNVYHVPSNKQDIDDEREKVNRTVDSALKISSEIENLLKTPEMTSIP
jgi:hypothetical protein